MPLPHVMGESCSLEPDGAPPLPLPKGEGVNCPGNLSEAGLPVPRSADGRIL
jgi:hypothetical protein